jgi:hypothetical protein
MQPRPQEMRMAKAGLHVNATARLRRKYLAHIGPHRPWGTERLPRDPVPSSFAARAFGNTQAGRFSAFYFLSNTTTL